MTAVRSTRSIGGIARAVFALLILMLAPDLVLWLPRVFGYPG